MAVAVPSYAMSTFFQKVSAEGLINYLKTSNGVSLQRKSETSYSNPRTLFALLKPWEV
jgi:hypothetical protein